MLIPPRRRQTREVLFEPRTIAEQETILSLTKDTYFWAQPRSTFLDREERINRNPQTSANHNTTHEPAFLAKIPKMASNRMIA